MLDSWSSRAIEAITAKTARDWAELLVIGVQDGVWLADRNCAKGLPACESTQIGQSPLKARGWHQLAALYPLRRLPTFTARHGRRRESCSPPTQRYNVVIGSLPFSGRARAEVGHHTSLQQTPPSHDHWQGEAEKDPAPRHGRPFWPRFPAPKRDHDTVTGLWFNGLSPVDPVEEEIKSRSRNSVFNGQIDYSRMRCIRTNVTCTMLADRGISSARSMPISVRVTPLQAPQSGKPWCCIWRMLHDYWNHHASSHIASGPPGLPLTALRRTSQNEIKLFPCRDLSPVRWACRLGRPS